MRALERPGILRRRAPPGSSGAGTSATPMRHRLPREFRSRPQGCWPPDAVTVLPMPLRRAGSHPGPPPSPPPLAAKLAASKLAASGAVAIVAVAAASDGAGRSGCLLRRAAARSPPSVRAPAAAPPRPEAPRQVPCSRPARSGPSHARSGRAWPWRARALQPGRPDLLPPATGPRRAPRRRARHLDARSLGTSRPRGARPGGPRLHVRLCRTTRPGGGGGARGALPVRGGPGPAGLGRHSLGHRTPRRTALRAGGLSARRCRARRPERRRAFPDTVGARRRLGRRLRRAHAPLADGSLATRPRGRRCRGATPRRVGAGSLALFPRSLGGSYRPGWRLRRRPAARRRSGQRLGVLARAGRRAARRPLSLFGRDPRHGDRLARSRLWLRAVLGGFRRAAEPARCPSGAAPLEPP